MGSKKDNSKTQESQIIKENQDLPNIQPSTEKIENENQVKEVIKKTSKLNSDGKTDNTEQNGENSSK
jgi:hypothetical protein